MIDKKTGMGVLAVTVHLQMIVIRASGFTLDKTQDSGHLKFEKPSYNPCHKWISV